MQALLPCTQAIKGMRKSQYGNYWELSTGCYGVSSLPTIELQLGDFIVPLSPAQYIVQVRRLSLCRPCCPCMHADARRALRCGRAAASHNWCPATMLRGCLKIAPLCWTGASLSNVTALLLACRVPDFTAM